MDSLIKLLIEKTSFGYKKCEELYSTKVSVLAVKYLLVILHRLPTNEVSQLAISVVQYSGSHSDGWQTEPLPDITPMDKTHLHKSPAGQKPCRT